MAACLADIASDDGRNIYPSIPYICWLMGKSERAIQYQLKTLVSQGVLVVVSESTRPGEYTEYRIDEDNLPKRKKWSEVRKQNGGSVLKRGAKIAPIEQGKGVQKTTEMGAINDTMGAINDISPYYDPSLDPSPTRAAPQPLPRLPGSDEEFNSKLPQVHYSKLREPDFFDYDIVAEMKLMYPALDVRGLFQSWVGARIVQRGLGKSRPRAKSTLPEYAQDFQNYLDACVSRQQNGNGNGHKPADDYRGPGRNTESDAARKKRENCPDCNGTNNKLIPTIDPRTQREIKVSAICKHENSTG